MEETHRKFASHEIVNKNRQKLVGSDRGIIKLLA